LQGIGGKEISVANTYAIPRKEFSITQPFQGMAYVGRVAHFENIKIWNTLG